MAGGATAATDRRGVRDGGRPLVQEWLPDDWPSDTFDLIVLREFCFYLDKIALATIAVKAKAPLRAVGTVLACHWLAPSG